MVGQLTGVPRAAQFGDTTGLIVEDPAEHWWVMLYTDPGRLSPLTPLLTLFEGKRVRVTVELDE